MKPLDDLSLFEGYFEESEVCILIAALNEKNRHIHNEQEIDSNDLDSNYAEGTEIYNFWRQDITTCNRSGIFVTHKPTKRPSSVDKEIALVIRKTIKFTEKYVNFDASQLLNDAIGNLEHAAIRFSLDRNLEEEQRLNSRRRFERGRTLSYYIVIGHKGMSNLVANNKCLYIKEPDLLIGPMVPDAMIKHPYVTEFRAKQRFHSRNHDKCSVTYQLIDNEDSIGTVYIPEGEDVFKLRPRKSSHRSSGLYITKTGIEESVHGKRMSEYREIKPEDIFNEPNVFRSRDEALQKSQIRTQQELKVQSEKYDAEKEKRLHEASMRSMEKDERVRKSSTEINMSHVKLATGVTSALLTTITLLIKALK